MKICLNNLSKDFQVKNEKGIPFLKTALDIQSFTFESGMIYGIIGDNSAGKSTLIKTLSGYYRPTTGTINVDDNTYGCMRSLHDNIGFLFESTFIKEGYPNKISESFSKVYSHWSEEKFKELLQAFKVPLHQNIETFSDGTIRKLNLSIALSHQANIIFLDEPTTGIDAESSDTISVELRKYMSDMNDNAIIIFTTPNDFSTISKTCDYVIFMLNGKTFFYDNIDVLYNPRATDSELKYMIYISQEDRFEERDRKLIGQCWRPCPFLPNYIEILCERNIPLHLHDCTTQRPSLEQIYLLKCKGEENKRHDK